MTAQIPKPQKNSTKTLHWLTLNVKEVKSDGNCFFRAFSHQLFSTDEYHLALRKSCLDYIEQNSQYYKNLIGSQNFSSYVAQKRKPGIWADNIEMHALSRLFNVVIVIYIANQVPIRIYSSNGKPDGVIRVLYKNQNHYDSVIGVFDNNLHGLGMDKNDGSDRKGKVDWKSFMF